MRTHRLLLSLFCIGLVTGCASVKTRRDADRKLTPEQLAVHDAIARFAKLTKATYLPVAPDRNIVGPLPRIPGCKMEIVTRDELVARNEGAKSAPLILAVNIYRHEAGSTQSGPFTVLVALEVSALSGFEEMPDGTGCEYIYRPRADGVDFIKQQGWVE